MDYDQAVRLTEECLELLSYAVRVRDIRLRQSGKSAARAGRTLGSGAI